MHCGILRWDEPQQLNQSGMSQICLVIKISPFVTIEERSGNCCCCWKSQIPSRNFYSTCGLAIILKLILHQTISLLGFLILPLAPTEICLIIKYKTQNWQLSGHQTGPCMFCIGPHAFACPLFFQLKFAVDI